MAGEIIPKLILEHEQKGRWKRGISWKEVESVCEVEGQIKGTINEPVRNEDIGR
jgi:hypothetical protein